MFFFPPRGACTRLLYPSEISARRAQRDLLPILQRWIQIDAVTRVICLPAELASPSLPVLSFSAATPCPSCAASPLPVAGPPPRGATRSGVVSLAAHPTGARAAEVLLDSFAHVFDVDSGGLSPRSRRRHLRSGPSSFTPR